MQCRANCGYESADYSSDDDTQVCDGCQDWSSQCECRSMDEPDCPEPEYMLCPQCRGTGKMVARHSSVWTSQDIYDDPDGFEYMMRGGYDVACDRCNGLRVVTTESEQRFNEDRADHFEMLREQGIYPGNPDYF